MIFVLIQNILNPVYPGIAGQGLRCFSVARQAGRKWGGGGRLARENYRKDGVIQSPRAHAGSEFLHFRNKYGRRTCVTKTSCHRLPLRQGFCDVSLMVKVVPLLCGAAKLSLLITHRGRDPLCALLQLLSTQHCDQARLYRQPAPHPSPLLVHNWFLGGEQAPGGFSEEDLTCCKTLMMNSLKTRDSSTHTHSLITCLKEIKIKPYTIFSHLKLCIAVARHNCKWLKMYVICEI